MRSRSSRTLAPAGAASLTLRALAVAARVCAWALALLVVCDAVLPAGARTYLLAANGVASRLLPAALSGLFVFQTPLGGAFRGDFAVLAIVLLVLDWIFRRASASLR